MKRVWSILLLLALLACVSGCGKSIGYEERKAEAASFLEKNRTQLEEAALKTIGDTVPVENTFEGISHIRYDDMHGYVVFDLDAQGMLGGQYWSLVYTPDGTYMDEHKRYSNYQENGNNLQIAEKLQDSWFFLWEDYDGREDLLPSQETCIE